MTYPTIQEYAGHRAGSEEKLNSNPVLGSGTKMVDSSTLRKNNQNRNPWENLQVGDTSICRMDGETLMVEWLVLC